MTRDVPPEEDQDSQPPQRPAGHVQSTRPGTLVGFALAGLVVGWLLRPVSIRVTGRAPDPVGWIPPLALLLVAAIVAGVAWLTYRDLHRRGQRLEPHKAVNRLVLAKSCALAGSMIAGGYFGYALSWWASVNEGALTRQRIVHSLVAGVAGVLIVVGSLLLERACRVRGGDDGDIG